MLVKLRRNWFGPDGVQYRAGQGLAEIGDDLKDELPTDAVIVSEDGTLPSRGTPTIPGYGGKPQHEQVLDLIPGAAPTHLILQAAETQPNADGLNPPKAPAPTPKEAEKLEEERVARERKEHDEAVKRSEEKLGEVRKEVEEGLERAKEVEANLMEARGETPEKVENTTGKAKSKL